MQEYKYRLVRLLVLVLIVVPIVAWFVIKPIRVVAPEVFGIRCYQDGLCIDDEERYIEARGLRAEALEFLGRKIYPLDGVPRVIFCASEKCASKFGLGAKSAVTFGTLGTVIGPRAWKPYYIRHELIHQLQGQKIGVIRCLLLPRWLKEGMAYSLSQDPRVPLGQPWESFRVQFNNWLEPTGIPGMWQKAIYEW